MMHIGIVGGGQLARMLALAGIPMGIKFSFLLEKNAEDSCVYLLGDCVRYDESSSYEDIYEKMGRPDVLTIEHEHVDLTLLRGLEEYVRVTPSVDSLEMLQSRINEKLLLTKSGIKTSKFFPFFNYKDLVLNSGVLQFPIVVKSALGGYDGKMQYRIANSGELLDLDLPDSQQGYIAEEFVNFEREISFIAVRSSSGKVLFYPPTENVHQKSILLSSLAPAEQLSEDLVKTGTSSIAQIMHSLNFVGVMAMECFLVGRAGEEYLVVNELSPRVHNSGHWTQAGCFTSQFENHVRAILDMPLGSTQHEGVSAMVNVLGRASVDPGYLSEFSSLHWYDKKVRENRKMGHINIKAESIEQINSELVKLAGFLTGASSADVNYS